jgi:hypothetical protein
MEQKQRWILMIGSLIAIVVLTIFAQPAQPEEVRSLPQAARPMCESRGMDRAGSVDAEAAGQALLEAVEREWNDLKRCVLEQVMTAFLIRWTTEPPPPPPPPGNNGEPPPPEGGGETPPPPPPPPPPGGGGEEPPIDPPIDPPPPQQTPEPASVLLAALGAGVVSFIAWRRRKRTA